MSKRIFSNEEQQLLQSNRNVKRCSAKCITYTTTFKEQAVSQYEAGFTSTEIFKVAGFDLSVIGKKQPKECLRRWRLHGCGDERGKHKSPKKIGTNTETNRMKWLEAEVKYLKAENAFLAQLRAKRAE